MSDAPRDLPPVTTEPLPADRPPWWLITSWGRWVAWVAYPFLMAVGPITRLRDGRSNALDVFLLMFLAGWLLYGLIVLVMTLLAYRRDPSLRNRRWPSPPPSQGLSRKVKRYVAFVAIAALGLVLLIYAGWGAALFVTVILGGVAIAIDRFDLFTDDVPTATSTSEVSQSDRDAASGDRRSDR